MARETITIQRYPDDKIVNDTIQAYELFGWEVIGNQRCQEFTRQDSNGTKHYSTFNKITFSREKSSPWYPEVVKLEQEFDALCNAQDKKNTSARNAAAKTQIESFCTALEAYYIDCGTYPSLEQGLSALRKKPEVYPISNNWSGPYLYKDPPKDPWGFEYEYLMPGPEGNAYGIRSYGADGIEGGDGKNQDITSWN